MFGETAKILAESLSCSAERPYLYSGGVYRLAGTGASDPETELASALLLKDSRTTTAGIFEDRFIKRYNRTGFWKTLKRSVQFPRSFRSLAAALKLPRAGLASPRVLLASRYYLVTESMGADRSIFLFLRPETCMDFLPFLVSMHEHGIYHGDLSLRNIYRAGEGRFGLIDLDGSRLFSGSVPASCRILDLARFISSFRMIVPEASPEETLDGFAEKYAASCPFDPRGKALSGRVERLLRRSSK